MFIICGGWKIITTIHGIGGIETRRNMIIVKTTFKRDQARGSFKEVTGFDAGQSLGNTSTLFHTGES